MRSTSTIGTGTSERSRRSGPENGTAQGLFQCWLDGAGHPTQARPMASEAEIRHEEAEGRGAFFIEDDGRRIAEQAYRRLAERRVRIVHTEVDPSLRGHGVARRLLDTAVAWARSTGTRVEASCPYARAQFERDASIRDVYDG
jgi:predicted GNAT family acetyltransferase